MNAYAASVLSLILRSRELQPSQARTTDRIRVSPYRQAFRCDGVESLDILASDNA